MAKSFQEIDKNSRDIIFSILTSIKVMGGFGRATLQRWDYKQILDCLAKAVAFGWLERSETAYVLTPAGLAVLDELKKPKFPKGRKAVRLECAGRASVYCVSRKALPKLQAAIRDRGD